MKTKPLFGMIQDGGDGSYYVKWTFDKEFVDFLSSAKSQRKLEYDDMGCDGDGFHYQTLNVPEECTAESLGIREIDQWVKDDYYKRCS